MTAEANVGVVGLAAMGASLARNLARHGNKVAVFNRHYSRTEKLITEHGSEGEFFPAKTMEEFVASLKKPRTAIIMVKAGEPTDAMIGQLADLMEPGDIIVDAGNAHFPDTIRREKAISARGLHFVGCGVSGGEEGALLGPSMMPGGSEESWKTLKPIFESIAAKAEGEPCVTHIGENGAGHFVKMVHNGIEYSDMQLISESYDLMRRALGMTPAEIGDVFEEWNKTELESYLIEITADVLHQVDKKTGKPLVDVIVDHAGMKGTGTWTVQSALDLAVPVTGIAEAVFARAASSSPELRAAAQAALQGPDGTINTDDRDAFVADVRQALWCAKVIAYAQGLHLIKVAGQQYGWDIDVAACARIWRAGCIIRAKLLDRISNEYAAGNLETLLEAPSISAELANCNDAWRRVVAKASEAGVPIPGFSSALSYYDLVRAKRTNAALTQGLRDFFGSHTYRRVDTDGTFHTQWSGDRSEVEAVDSH